MTREVWHIVKLLESLDGGIKTQMDICRHTRTSNYQLKKYLKKLAKLNFIERATPEEVNFSRNYSAILWKITDKGKDFKDILRSYSDA